MIAHINGKVVWIKPTEVVVEANGVGYLIFISLNTFSAIQTKIEVLLHTYLKISEDAHQLYGFYTLQEKEMFLNLISVSGIGGGTARLMLSSLTPQDVYRAITLGQTNVIESIKGIGKKTAERVILELKDKLIKQKGVLNDVPSGSNLQGVFIEDKGVNNWQTMTIRHDAVAALVALGINRNQAESAVQKILLTNPEYENLEGLIKQALQSLSGL